MLFLTSCGSNDAEDVVVKEKHVLKIYIFAPDRPVITRADIGQVDASDEENAIHSIHVWAFETGTNTLVGHVYLSDPDMNETFTGEGDETATGKTVKTIGAGAPNENTVYVNKPTRMYIDCGTPDAVIYYTLDDSCPCQNTSGRAMLVGENLPLDGTTVADFIIAGYKEGMDYSDRLTIHIRLGQENKPSLDGATVKLSSASLRRNCEPSRTLISAKLQQRPSMSSFQRMTRMESSR